MQKKKKSRPSPWRRLDKEHLKSYVRKYRKTHPLWYREKQLRKVYGISLATYNALLATQGGVCAICGCPEQRNGNNGKTKMLAVDHDHERSHVRGLLCQDCNTALGLLREDRTRAFNLIRYIDEACS